MKHHFQILQKILLSLESNEGAQEIKIYKRKKKKNQFLLSISFLEKILMIHFNNNINNNKHPLLLHNLWISTQLKSNRI